MERPPTAPGPRHSGRAPAFVLLLAGLLVHAWGMRFLTDDAFIAFRYARNLAAGLGPVFNPGGVAVEGFSSPLWMLLLAGGAALGVPPERAATALGLAATALTAWLAVRLAGALLPAAAAGRRAASPTWALVALVLLALTPSVATWATGGLETRLFEALVLAAVVRALAELRALRAGAPARSACGWLLALVAWTRPEGLLLALTTPLGALAAGDLPRPARRRWLARTLAVVVASALALFLTRWVVYGTLLPNTYHAKLDGRTWWPMGAAYAEAFALEHGLLLLAPFALAGALRLVRSGRPEALAVPAAALLPYLLYVVAIGGDHFAWRPLDLLFPFGFALVAAGAASWTRGRHSGLAVGAGLLIGAVALVELPLRVRAAFPGLYRAGYPGLAADADARDFPPRATAVLYRLPLLRALETRYRSLLQRTTRAFVGIRREEHALFAALADREGRALAELVDRGLLPPDTHVALDCVGAIPYRSGLVAFDRLGLTNAEVARAPFLRPELSAHGKYATPEQARDAGVDLWAVDNVRLLWHADEPWFRERLHLARAQGEELVTAEVEPGLFLFAWLPQGLEAARARFPGLRFESTRGTRQPAGSGR